MSAVSTTQKPPITNATLLDDTFWVSAGIPESTNGSTSEEQEILEELRSATWDEVVTRRFANDHSWKYKMIADVGRSAFLDILPLRHGGTFLDVGSGWGQVSIPLSRFGHVVSLDLSLPMLRILREIARQERVSLTYVCADFLRAAFESVHFDGVIFNGSLEYMFQEGTSLADAQCAALKKAGTILKPDGVLYIGIENSLGIKYILGAPDDHTNVSHLMFRSEAEAAQVYREKTGKDLRVKTWSLTEYGTMLESCGFEVADVYGCFPDYKLIRKIIPLREVNSIIGAQGVPFPPHSGVDGSLLPNQDLFESLYRLLAKNGIAQYFCPSYAIVARKR